uniref:Candidate secreted effector n=1 Tax=Meloidogyne incognita TaxID=6306 RepID=A0A914N1M6_MELIC
MNTIVTLSRHFRLQIPSSNIQGFVRVFATCNRRWHGISPSLQSVIARKNLFFIQGCCVFASFFVPKSHLF